jgi:hypothetical protein
MIKYQITKNGKVLKELNDDYDTAIFACNNDYGPGMKILTNSKEKSESWTHFEYKEKL